ncbi:MAG: hypothetical protein AAF950_05205 [Pseudomonadota bacterium]
MVSENIGKLLGRITSQRLESLLEDWIQNEAGLTSLINKAADSKSNPREEEAIAALGEKQLELLAKISSCEAESALDAFAKLLVWKAVTMPDGQSSDWLEKSDYLVLSAITDFAASLEPREPALENHEQAEL